MGPSPACRLLALLSTTSALAVNFPDSSDDILVFSGGSEPRTGRQADTSSPWVAAPCPGGAAWCEDAEDYPQLVVVEEQVAAVDFIRTRIFDPVSDGLVFGADSSPAPPEVVTRVVAKPQVAAKPLDPLDGARFGDYEDEEAFGVAESRACDHRKSTVYPKKARNVNGAFVFIVNDDEYKQAVDIEQCLGEGETCRNQDDAPSFGKTVCRQKYTTYKMYVINEAGEQVYDTFSLPSACLCHHRSDFAIRHALLGDTDTELPECPVAEKLTLPRGSAPSPAAFAHSHSTTSPPPETTSAASKIHFGERRKRQAGGCEDSATFCEEEAGYPAELVLTALNKHPVMSDGLFQQLFDSQCKDKIQTRIFNIDEEQLCYGVPNIIFPKKAKNLKDEWVWVVNVDNYTQSVEVEECDNSTVAEDLGRDQLDATDFGKCLYSGAGGNDPDLTVCRQLYTEHKLLSLTAEGQLEVDSFKLPSACACFVREDFLLEFRGNMDEVTEEASQDPPTLPPQVEEASESTFVFSGK